MVGIRPEHLSDPRSGHPDGSVEAEIVGEVVEPLGSLTLVHIHIDALPVSAFPGPSAGDALRAGQPPAPMVAALDGRIAAVARWVASSR